MNGGNPETPQNEEQLAEAIREASENKTRVFALGNGLRYAMPERVAPVSAAKLNDTLFFKPEDMVYGAGAGKSVGEVQAELAEKNMYLPIDPFSPETTIGSAMACNDRGASRLFMGGLRDFIIGVAYVNAAGKIVKGGGSVVKNVAGYDLMKMMLGSKGGLGALTRIHFKIVPKPVDKTAFFRKFDDLTWIDGLKKVMENKVPLSSLELSSADGAFLLDARFEGSAKKIERIAGSLEGFLGKGEIVPEADRETLLRHTPSADCNSSGIKPFLKAWGVEKGDLRVRFDSPSSVILNEGFWSKIRSEQPTARFIVHPFGGDVQFVLPEKNRERQIGAIQNLLAHLQGCEAHFELLSAEPGVFSQAPLPVGDHAFLDRKLKKTLDPRNVFYSPYFDHLDPDGVNADHP